MRVYDVTVEYQKGTDWHRCLPTFFLETGKRRGKHLSESL